jgi:hypothetical protein
MTVGQWVRRALREARAAVQPAREFEMNLKLIRRAAEYSFPTADIEQMLREIERG